MSACKGCGTELPPKTWQGRDRLWCSDRCRKQTLYSRPCADCGEPMNGSDGNSPNASVRCVSCANKVNGAARTVWTREAILAAIREWAAEYGEPPRQADWNPVQARNYLHDERRARRFEEAGGRWPWFTKVVREFGSWNAAIAAAGFNPRQRFGGRANPTRAQRAAA